MKKIRVFGIQCYYEVPIFWVSMLLLCTEEACRMGQMKSGIGWIALSYAKRE